MNTKSRNKAITVHDHNDFKHLKKQNYSDAQAIFQKQFQTEQQPTQHSIKASGLNKFEININLQSHKRGGENTSVSPNFNRTDKSNNSNKRHTAQSNTVYIPKTIKQSHKINSNLKLSNKNNISVSSPSTQTDKRSISQEKKGNLFTNQFSISPSNAERVNTDSSCSKKGAAGSEMMQSLQLAKQQKIQNFFPKSFEREQIASIDSEIQKISFAFKKYECICLNFLQKESKSGINLNTGQYCERLYKFLDGLNPNIRLFAIMKSMFELPLNQLLYDLAQLKAQSAQRSNEQEIVEQIVDENRYLFTQNEQLRSENERLSFYIQNLKTQQGNKENQQLNGGAHPSHEKLLNDNVKLRKLAKKYKKQMQQIQEKEEKIMKLLYAIRKKGIGKPPPPRQHCSAREGVRTEEVRRE